MSCPLTAQKLSLPPLLPPPFLPFLPFLLLLLLSSSSSPPPFFLPRGAFGTTISLPSTTLLLKTSTYYTSVGTEEEEGKKFGAEFCALKWWYFPDTTLLAFPPGLRKQPLFLWPPPPVHQLRIPMQRLMSSAFATSPLTFPEQIQKPSSSLGVKGGRAGHGLGVAHVQKRIQQRERGVWERNTPLNETRMSWAVLELPGAASWQRQEPLTAPGTLGAPWKRVPPPS